MRYQDREWRNFTALPSTGGTTADPKLASGAPDVLPLLSRDIVEDALQRLPSQAITQTLRHGVVPVPWHPDQLLFATCGPKGAEHAGRHGLSVVARVSPSDFHNSVGHIWGEKILGQATLGLFNTSPHLSAKRRLTANQIAAFLTLVACFGMGLALLPEGAVWTAASALIGMFFFSVVAMRLFCLFPLRPSLAGNDENLADAELPVYSVLVPMFKETSVLNQLLRALSNLNYPAEKLDIKIIVEEFDITMQRALLKHNLPAQIEVIVVPRGSPQTKPKALNYALQFCRGQLLTIYDAEDIPEPNQLREAARKFAHSGEKVACLQAKLTFYNPDENWLTRQFSVEYATLFGLILPALAALNLPLPLGGTSNHFRTGILHKIGGWDPYNVTEDADLGLRLARLGYRTGVLDSHTFEEATTQFMNWLRQRARWIKGFMQTWLVHMRNPLRATRELGLAGFWILQAFTAGIFVSALFHPFFIAVTLWYLASGPLNPSFLLTVLNCLNLGLFALGYCVTMLAGCIALRKRGLGGWWFTIATMPVYWLLISVAAWLALWQFIFAPFTWNKTEHGLSKLQG